MGEGAGPVRARRTRSFPEGHLNSGTRHLPSPGATEEDVSGSLSPSFSPPRRPSERPGHETCSQEPVPTARRVHSPRLPRARARAGLSWESPWRQRRGGAPVTPRPLRDREARFAAPAPAAVPPPAPLPGPQRPSAPPEGGSAINKRGSVARGPRSCCTSRQISGSGSRVSRHRETRQGRRARPARPPPRPPRLRSSPLPLHGSAAAAAHAALQSGGASGQRVRTLGQGLNCTADSSPAPVHPLPRAEARENAGRKEEREETSGKSGLWSPRDSPAGRRLRPGRRRWVARNSGAAAAERRSGASGRPRAPARGPRPRLSWPSRYPLPPKPPLQPERGSAGLEHVRV